MNSRREFLEASSLALTTFAVDAAAETGQAVKAGVPEPSGPGDYWNDLPNRMIAGVAAARATRKGELAKVTSSATAEARISMVRAKVWKLIGGELDKSPLNAKITGVVDGDSYRVEKIVFESQPEFFVTANLYLPKMANKPFPGILAPLGHTDNGKAYASYRTLFQNLARKGFAVLAWDPPGQGERVQYINPKTNQSLYGSTGEHDRFGLPALLTGSTTNQFEVWDGIRALDYLLSRPEIDAKRIGCCGHSGGGTQTMFLCALEPRIRAAVVVEGHTENVAGAGYQPPGAYADAEQNLIGGLKAALDRGDLLGAFAPKPLKICYTSNDNGSTYSAHYVQGTHEIFEELRNIYGVYGAKDRLALFDSSLPHDYDYFHRRATYEWFNRWLLNGQGDADETAFDDSPESTLWCTTTGQVLTSLGGRSAVQVNHDRLRAIRAHMKRGQLDKSQVQKELRSALNLPSATNPLKPVLHSGKTRSNVVIEQFEYRSEPGIRVPGWFLKPAAGGPRFPVVLALQDQGRDRLFDQWPLVERLVQAGIAICSIDLRTCGSTMPRLPSEGPRFYGYGVEFAYAVVNLGLGSPIIGQQTWDLLRGLDFLSVRKDVAGDRIGVFGAGTSGLACMFGASLDGRVRSMLLHRTLASLESVVASKDYELPSSAVAFGMLRGFDLPELCAIQAPRPIWLVNSVGPRGNELALSEVGEAYEPAVQAYSRVNEKERLSLRVEEGPADAAILEWARTTLA